MNKPGILMISGIGFVHMYIHCDPLYFLGEHEPTGLQRNRSRDRPEGDFGNLQR